MYLVAQNLVPNGDFVFPDTCSGGHYTGPSELPPWFTLYSSPDNYHPCFGQGLSVPQSFGGYAEPLSGEGYIGLYTYASNMLIREFMTVELTEPLTPGIDYLLSFWVSRADSAWYASKNIGAYVSTSPPQPNIQYLHGLNPQVYHEGDTFLTSSINWTQIQGVLTAMGGERFLTLGNFDNNKSTDTLFVSGGGVFRPAQPFYWSGAYYYIDKVSLIPDSIFQSINESELTFSTYPNPATFNLTINSKTELTQAWLTDLTGRRLSAFRNLSGQWQIDVSVLPSGIYLVEAVTEDGRRSVQKVVVE